jgi:manganese-dependent inorganic pyrophosphatase
MSSPVLVIGHKNPDTDAICSAIGYADLLRRTGTPDAEAVRCGEINARTAFALEQARLPAPRLVMDVRPTAGQIARRDVITARADESLREAFARMRGPGLRTVPVLDADHRVTGMLSLQKIVDLLLPETGQKALARVVHTSLRRIAQNLDGAILHPAHLDDEEPYLMTVGAMRAADFAQRLAEYPPERIVLVVGNRSSIQEPAIDYGVRAIVVTGGCSMDEPLLARARARGVAVLTSPHDTASTTILIKSSKRVTHAVARDFIRFEPGTPLEKLRAEASASSATLFPVLDEDGRLLGVFSKSDLVAPPLHRLVLVDHNEFSQAVSGVEQAEILEVLDHHRLGGNLATREPIRFINEPLGSTCSIVARQFRQHGLTPDPAIALCLATGLIADTLHLTSPTTTPEDRAILDWLGTLTGRDWSAYAEAFFAAGSALQAQPAPAVVRGDCKEFTEAGWRFAIAQVEELGLERFWERKEELRAALDALRAERSLDFACLFITDIGRHTSVMLVAGDHSVLDAIDYPRLEPGLHELEGIVSRKKQLLPHLTRLLRALPRPRP